jgi:hypothetical protein
MRVFASELNSSHAESIAAAGLTCGNFGVKFLSTLKTDPVRPFPDREHAAHLAVMAPKYKLENPQYEFHEF